MTIPAALSAIGAPPSVDGDQDLAGLDTRRIGLEVDANRGALGGTGLIIEAAIVFRTFDDVVHHQPAGEMHLLVRAEPLGGEELILGRAIDGEGAIAVIEPDDVLLVDIVHRASFHPFRHAHVTPLPQPLKSSDCGTPRDKAARSAAAPA